MYLKDGTSVNSHFQIDESQKTIMIGSTPCFGGITSIYCSKQNMENLLYSIYTLENKLTEKIEEDIE